MPPRLLALFPASFFVLCAIINARAGTLYNLVWVCNVMNLLLAASLAARWPRGLWIATLWILAGSPLWLWDAIITRVFEVHSFLTHVAAAGIGLYALRAIPRPGPVPRPRHIWWQAVLAGIGVQLLARALTPPEINVNEAFGLYGPVARALPALAQHFALAWSANIATFCVIMLVLETALTRILRS